MWRSELARRGLGGTLRPVGPHRHRGRHHRGRHPPRGVAHGLPGAAGGAGRLRLGHLKPFLQARPRRPSLHQGGEAPPHLLRRPRARATPGRGPRPRGAPQLPHARLPRRQTQADHHGLRPHPLRPHGGRLEPPLLPRPPLQHAGPPHPPGGPEGRLLVPGRRDRRRPPRPEAHPGRRGRGRFGPELRPLRGPAHGRRPRVRHPPRGFPDWDAPRRSARRWSSTPRAPGPTG